MIGRNKETMWFQKGYKQAVSDRKIESFVPRTLGIYILIALAFVDPMIPLAFFTPYAAFDYFEWRDEKTWAPDYEPPR